MKPTLVAISDVALYGVESTVRQSLALARAAQAGSIAILIRDYATTARQRLALAGRMMDGLRAAGQALWIADRIDLALLLDADCLHLGERAVTPKDARRLWGERPISRAVHELATPGEGEDTLVLSPIVKPRKGRPALGLEALGRARRSAGERRLYALGGIDAGSARACLEAGADGVAVMGAVYAAGEGGALADALGIRR